MEIGTLRAFKKKKGLEVELWSRESFVSIGGVHGDRERERESYGGWKEDNDFFLNGI